MKAIDLTGKEFRDLKVIAPTSSKGKNKEQWWICECKCGNRCVRRSCKLRNGEAKSCGCDRNFGHNRKTDRETAIKTHLFQCFYASAGKRGIENRLTFDEFCEIIDAPCHYCGRKGVAIATEKRNRHGGLISPQTIRHNGIDRVNSNGHYETGNVVASCKNCNFAKSTMNIDEFRNWVEAVYEHFIKNKPE